LPSSSLRLWNLALKIFLAPVGAESFDPTDHAVFQSVFAMIFTVILAPEFERSLLVTVERHDSVVQVRADVLLAMLAVLRKLIILDLAATSGGGGVSSAASARWISST
jgi:uncharacterized membrane protein (DUF373 family)